MDQLVAGYGYFALAAVVGLESLGLPVPGETALVAAAIYGGVTHRLSLAAIVAVAFAAAVIGDQVGFQIGRRGGSRVLGAIAGRSRRAAVNVAVVRRLFVDRGTPLLMLGRFISVVRTYVAIGAGASGLSWRRFTAANVAASALWASTLAVFSYVVARLTRHAAVIPELAGGLIAAIATGLGVIWVRRAKSALSEDEIGVEATKEPTR
ncbi:MAG TPA: DedA family protein [Acidimicrobiales bacterium]|nr:DedA family protein [Acidimicrobiales bacterium]